MNRYEFVMTLTPEEFLTFMTTPKCSSVCEHNANGERWKTKCRGEFLESGCDACKRDFWLKEEVGEVKK